MTEQTREKELDALKADIARLRDEIKALVTGVKKFSKTKSAEYHAEGDRESIKQECSENNEQGPGAWTDFQHVLGKARAQGDKIVKDLASEIERHPLVGSMAAFGLGFIIAKLWYRGRKP